MATLLPIGRFAQLSGLTVKALRHYDTVGLLRPAHVDPASGYRRYAPSQLDDALVIRRLRGLDVPVEEIRSVLRVGDAAAVLAAHRGRIEARAAEAERILGELGAPRDVLYRIEVKDVPPQQVAFIRGPEGIAEAIGELLGYAGDVGTGPPFAVRTPGLEVALPVAPGVVPHGRIEVRSDDGFRAIAALYEGPYERLAGAYRGLWDILQREGVEPAAEPREVFLGGDGLVELVWPLAVAPGWLPSPARFTEPIGR